MREINSDSIYEYVKMLIELGNTYTVQEDSSIMNNLSKEIIHIPSGKSSVPLKVFKDGMMSDGSALLAPFKEQCGLNREREWFFDNLQLSMSYFVKEIMAKLITDVVGKKDDNYQQYQLMNLISGEADVTMLNELDKLRPYDILYINYNKKTKTAVAETRLSDPELEEDHSKFRKKSWSVFRTLFREIIGTLEPEDMYIYQSRVLSIPETDAKLHVITALLKTIAPFARDVLDREINVDVLEDHLANLEGYAKAQSWISTTSPISEGEQPMQKPWETASPFQPQPQVGAGLPTMPIPASQLAYSQPMPNPYGGYGYPNPYGPPPMSPINTNMYGGQIMPATAYANPMQALGYNANPICGGNAPWK